MKGKQVEDNREHNNPKLDRSDLIALMIAAFQVVVPAFLVLMAVLMLFYWLLRLWAK
jgi:hypothetical protein